jgi:hypothetical protein
MSNLLEQKLRMQYKKRFNNAYDDLIERTLLIEEELPNSLEPITLRFLHKSFQEFFVANYLFDIMMNDSGQMANDFQRFISPEVSEFLKECINRLHGHKAKIEKIVQNSILSFNANINNETPRNRMARQQIAYYLGNIKDNSASSFLIKQIDLESDLWIRRGIIIGLSFGGFTKYLDEYVDLLYNERANNAEELCVENHVNIGFTLSFFGDQPFNVLEPDCDQKMTSCKNSMERLLYQLGTDTDMGSWRLNLYTFIDLFKYRYIAKEDVRSFLVSNANKIERILRKIRANESCSWWPEITQLINIVTKLKRNAKYEGNI